MTSPDRTVFDVARRVERRRAVAVIDAMLHRRMTTVELARQFALAQSMFRDQRRVFEILPLLDGRSESPMESGTIVRATIDDIRSPTALLRRLRQLLDR